mgnify:CR=1 FL=1
MQISLLNNYKGDDSICNTTQETNKEKIFKHSVSDVIFKLQNDEEVQFINIEILGLSHVFIVKFLKWDIGWSPYLQIVANVPPNQIERGDITPP